MRKHSMTAMPEGVLRTRLLFPRPHATRSNSPRVIHGSSRLGPRAASFPPRTHSPSPPPPELLTETLLKLEPVPALLNQACNSLASGTSGSTTTVDELKLLSDLPL